MPVSRSGGGKVLTKITGSVFDDKGEPAIGTSIMVAGSKAGIVTNSYGQSTLSVPLGKELRPIWERRGVFLFFLPPYSHHFYSSTGFLLYATNQTLAAIGTDLNVHFAHAA